MQHPPRWKKGKPQCAWSAPRCLHGQMGCADDGALAAVVVYEELSILQVFDAFTDEGAQVVLEGHLTPEDLAEALDATDAS